MRLEHALFLAAVISFTLALVVSFWIDRFGGGYSLLGFFLTAIGLTMVLYLLFVFVPSARTPVIIFWLIVTAITLLVNLIS